MSPTSPPKSHIFDPRRVTIARHTTPPTSLRISISPPPSRNRKSKTLPISNQNARQRHARQRTESAAAPDLAAVEAGEIQIRDHLEYFSTYLSQLTKPLAPLSIHAFKNLYLRNQNSHGRHFVIHQHDHPIAGVHYDLRLQINETSSISWAIMYGLPGNVNSRRLNRNATETRVHNVWVSK